jgi:hypothetical protein
VQEASSHPEVNQESATGLKSNNEILTPPFDRGDSLPLQLRGHGARLERSCQTAVRDLHAEEAPTCQRGRESRPDGLDLG